ncbi:MAG: beta-ketoacyl-[acyl-carrier-protein] synthase family protein [Victivallis vadensis]
MGVIPVGVSGFGAVSAVGVGVEATRAGLFAPPPRPALPHRFGTVLELPVFEIASLPGTPGIAGGFTMELLRLALDEALREAGLTEEELAGKRVGVCIGTTVACQLNNIPFYADLRAGRAAPREAFRSYVKGDPAEWVRRRYRLEGPALTVSNACTSGADAVGIASLWIREGVCDLAIAGGADELNQVPLDGFHALGVCSAEPCRPFDVDRSGLNLGEGAGVVILESPGSAKRRGIGRKFIVGGFGKSADAYHITQPHPEGIGLERAVRQALESAGLTPARIAFVNAHGTGTPANDRVEAQTLARVFGPELKYMSTKSMTGHTLGAAGALEFIFCCLMLEARRAVKNHGYRTPSEEIPVPPLTEDFATDGAWALSTSLAFGGSNTALAVGRIP